MSFWFRLNENILMSVHYVKIDGEYTENRYDFNEDQFKFRSHNEKFYVVFELNGCNLFALRTTNFWNQNGKAISDEYKIWHYFMLFWHLISKPITENIHLETKNCKKLCFRFAIWVKSFSLMTLFKFLSDFM